MMKQPVVHPRNEIFPGSEKGRAAGTQRLRWISPMLSARV